MSEEKVIVEAKLGGGSDGTKIPFSNPGSGAPKAPQPRMPFANPEFISQNIAKSLTNDFMMMITIAGLKQIFKAMPDSKDFIDGLREYWKERCSKHIAGETKAFQDAINRALSSEKEVTDDTRQKMDQSMKVFCSSCDRAVSLATESVNGIVDSILKEEAPAEVKPDGKEAVK